MCRRELGVWRLAHGDAGGLADLARSARLLPDVDAVAASVALAHLSRTLHDRGDGRAPVLAAAATAIACDPAGIPASEVERRVLADMPEWASTPAPTPATLRRLLRDLESEGVVPV